MNNKLLFSVITLFLIGSPITGNSFVTQYHKSIWQVSIVKEHPAYDLFSILPPGNYSGITYLGDNLYALVSDKSKTDGIHLMTIHINMRTGNIRNIRYLGFQDSNETNKDIEDIVFVPISNTIFMASEASTTVREFKLSFHTGNSIISPTGRKLVIPTIFTHHLPNKGLEALAYNSVTGLFWTTSETTLHTDLPTLSLNNPSNFTSSMIRLQSFTSDLQPALEYAYLLDKPSSKTKSSNCLVGVSAIAAADNGLLFILERELFIPNKKIGAWCTAKIYVVNPQIETSISMNEKLTKDSPWVKKTLLWQQKTRFNLFCHSFANYEGMCFGPKLEDGTLILFLISDSQNQHKHVLSDWVKPIVVRMDELDI